MPRSGNQPLRFNCCQNCLTITTSCHKYIPFRPVGQHNFFLYNELIKLIIMVTALRLPSNHPMKRNALITFLVLAILFWGCARKQLPPVILAPTQPAEIELADGDAIFSEAEELYMNDALDEAVEKYADYLDIYPEGPLADAALYKIGLIYTCTEDFEKARRTYDELIETFPESPLAVEAMIEIMDINNQQGAFADTINDAFRIPEESLFSSQLFRKYDLLGDAYMQVNAPEDAFYFYSANYRRVAGPAKERVLKKIKAAAAQLNEVYLTSLLSRVDDPVIRGHLLYQFGLTCVEKGKTEDGLKALTELILKLSQHEMALPAQELINEINSKAIDSPFTVGCLLPLSGRYKAYGIKALRGIELAYSRHVQSGRKPSIRLMVKDTQADPFRTVAAIREMDKANAAAIIGPMVTSEPAALEAQARNIPIITFTQKENITTAGNFVFRNFITPKMQARTLATFAMTSLGVERFAILYPDEHYGTTYMNLFWDAIQDQGGKIAAIESYDPEVTDFAVPIKKLVGLYYPLPKDLQFQFEIVPEEESPWWLSTFNPRAMVPYFPNDLKIVEDLYLTIPDKPPGPVATAADRGRGEYEEPRPVVDFQAIFIPDAPSKAGLIIPQLVYHDINDVYLLGTNLWHSDELIEMSRQYVQNAVITEGFAPDSSFAPANRFVDTFVHIFGETPGFIEAVTYDSARLLFQALGMPGLRFKSQVKDEMLNLVDYPGVTGTTHFDYSGDAIKAPFVLKVKAGRFVQVRQP
jgi:branched-chain amino acid transport system substrate-binding protein